MRSEAVLQPLGIKLSQLLMESNADTFNNTLNSFVGIATIQVSLCFLSLEYLHVFSLFPLPSQTGYEVHNFSDL